MNLNPFKFIETRIEQKELKDTFIKEMAEEFEKSFLSLVKSNFKDSTRINFSDITVSELEKLRDIAASLHGYAKKILDRFPVSEDLKKPLQEIEKITISIVHDQKVQMFIHKWKTGGMKGDTEISGDISNDFIQKMPIIFTDLHKLKNADFSSIFSAKIKNSK